MIKETKVMQESIVRQKFCDDCGIEIDIGLSCSKASCGFCGKDLCEKCIGHEDPSWGDYRGSIWCKKCWELGKDYRPLIDSLEEEIENAYKEWQMKCKKQ